MIIVFSGTDGAGKSTQIDTLCNYFTPQGKKTVYLWSRGGYTPLFSAIKRIVRKLLKKKLPAQGQSKDRDKMLKNDKISALWLTLATIDLILQWQQNLEEWFGQMKSAKWDLFNPRLMLPLLKLFRDKLA